jgi:hypothetical protein
MQSLMINVLKNTNVKLGKILDEGGDAMESIACT